jgi:hypothetical protein
MPLLLLMHSYLFLKASNIPSDPEYEDSDPTGMSMRTTITEKTMIHLKMMLLRGLNDQLQIWRLKEILSASYLNGIGEFIVRTYEFQAVSWRMFVARMVTRVGLVCYAVSGI